MLVPPKKVCPFSAQQSLDCPKEECQIEKVNGEDERSIFGGDYFLQA
jgi:hypothetical protein